jgi:hypothetical protein
VGFSQESFGLDEFLDPLSRCLDAESSRRVMSAYEALINAADFVSILKAKARRHFPNAS